ncbi:LppP/LprE family lipoprotein [Streptomyces sp. NPDC059766]|uniref:LppP/LprE family lipoprotein n=1 Tax=Streptomyces sp. NPDC059766 TaxID=3346940 RepID=UPI003652A861
MQTEQDVSTPEPVLRRTRRPVVLLVIMLLAGGLGFSAARWDLAGKLGLGNTTAATGGSTSADGRGSAVQADPSTPTAGKAAAPERTQRTACPADSALLAAAHKRLNTAGDPALGLKQCWPGWDTAVLITTGSADAMAHGELVVFRDENGTPTEAAALTTGSTTAACDGLRRMNPPADLLGYACEGTPDPEPFDKNAALRTMSGLGYRPVKPIGELSGPLRAVWGVVDDGGHFNQVFLFYGNRFLGTAPLSDVGGIPQPGGSSVTLQGNLRNPDDPECCPSGGSVDYIVKWNGTRLISNPPFPADS